MRDWRAVIWCAVMLWGGGLVFSTPLQHKPGWQRWLLPGLLLCLPGAWMLVSPPLWLTVAGELASLAALLLFVRLCAALRRPSALYVAVWAQLAAHTAWELCLLVQRLLPAGTPAGPAAAAQLGVTVALYLALWATIARWMPTGHSYSIGPRQLSSALLLDVLFLFLFYALRRLPAGSGWDIALLLQLCQFYCLTVLVLQTELFKKSAIKKELDALNLLHTRQQQQYRMARQHVHIINRICHELKVELAALRQAGGLPPDARLQQMETSLRAYDAMFHTGSEVLDTLLTDKSLQCSERGIQLNCVADGARLQFLDKGDLVTLFESALDNAIEAVEHLTPPERRLVDVQVYERQQFLVINLYNPLPGPLRFEDGLPVPTHPEREYRGYGLKSVRRTLQKYGGVLRIDTSGGFFTLRMLIPLPASAA